MIIICNQFSFELKTVKKIDLKSYHPAIFTVNEHIFAQASVFFVKNRLKFTELPG